MENEQMFGGETPYTDFFGFGIGKKAKARIAVKVEKRQAIRKEKRTVRLANKASRGYARISKADSRRLLAEQGINQGSGVGEILGQVGKSVGNIASSLMGGGEMQDTSQQNDVMADGGMFGGKRPVKGSSYDANENLDNNDMDNSQQQNALPQISHDVNKKKNTALIIAVAVVALVVIVLLLKKKK